MDGMVQVGPPVPRSKIVAVVRVDATKRKGRAAIVTWRDPLGPIGTGFAADVPIVAAVKVLFSLRFPYDWDIRDARFAHLS
jgi:hypothetical protein